MKNALAPWGRDPSWSAGAQDATVRPGGRARVDSAHPQPGVPPTGHDLFEGPSALATEPAGDSHPPSDLLTLTAADAEAQLHQQAAQLAEHLRRWHAELDRRERRLQEQLAELENEWRRFRLWMREVQQQLGNELSTVKK